MKLWIDDVRPAPDGYVWIKTVNAAKMLIRLKDINGSAPEGIELIDIDHDAGECGPPDYIKLLDWLEETGRNYPIRIHSANPVGVANMRSIIERNGWREIK
jgi:hypothetical protein